MKKTVKKLILFILTAVLTVATLAGCATYSGEKLTGYVSDAAVSSNGGFAVEKGDYVYFINGLDDYDAKNKLGDVVKSSLMRIAKSDMTAGNYADAQTVVPSLLVAQNYDAGIFIFGDYVYYATPTSTKNKDGEVENTYLDFKRSKLDGTETMKSYFFRSSDNTAAYRFCEIDDVVYCLHISVENSVTSLYSYNTETDVDTLLVKNLSEFKLYTDASVNNGTVYYTMSVPTDESGSNAAYNQIYRVKADATTPAHGDDYNYASDKDDNEDGEPDFTYINFGELVLDGIGSAATAGKYNPDMGAATTPFTPDGYTYSLTTYANGGLYYARVYNVTTGIHQESSPVIKLVEQAYDAATAWNSVTCNYTVGDAYHKLIAVNSTNASVNAIYYTDANEEEHYIYTNDKYIYNVTAQQTATGCNPVSVTLSRNVNSAGLIYLNNSLNGVNYLYFRQSNDNGQAIYRIAYDGTADKYNALLEDATLNYTAVKLYDIDHETNYYNPEIINGHMFYINCDNHAYKYTYAVKLASMSNASVKATNEIIDKLDTMRTEMSSEHANLANLITYYYITGKTDLFDVEENYALYNKFEKDNFNAFVTCAKTDDFDFTFLKVGDTLYNTRESLYNKLGVVSDADVESLNTAMENYVLMPEEETTDLTWLWWTIGCVGGAALIAAGVLATIIIIKKKKA